MSKAKLGVKLSRIILLVSLLLLASCQSPYQKYLAQDIKETNLYLDHHFPSYKSFSIETKAQVFAVNEEMIALAKSKIRKHKDIDDRADDLVKAIFSHTNREIIYDSGANTVAIETFNSRKANCMSLTILAYVLATEADFLVDFQQVEVPEYWVQRGKYSVLASHVNLLITAEDYTKKLLMSHPEHEIDFVPEYVHVEVDFDPNAAQNSFRRRIISQDTMLAMFYNNKGAKLLINKEFDHAYAYFKAATLAEPDYDASWSNLGILYRMKGFEQEAYQAYSMAINENRNNLSALTNLSILFKKQDKQQLAQEIDKILLAKRQNNPYYHTMLADNALFHGDYQDAIGFYQNALALNHKLHNAYLGLAKAYYKVDNIELSQRMMKRAIKYNEDKQIDRLYSAKLNFLKSLSK